MTSSSEFAGNAVKAGKYDPARLDTVAGDGKYPGRISYPLGSGRAVVVSQDTLQAREVLQQWLKDREERDG